MPDSSQLIVGVHCTKSTLIPCLEHLKRNSVIVWNKWSCLRIPSTVRHPCISTRIGGPSSESWLNCMIFGLLTTVNTCMSASLESGKLDKYLVITFFQSLNSRVIKKKKKTCDQNTEQSWTAQMFQECLLCYEYTQLSFNRLLCEMKNNGHLELVPAFLSSFWFNL